MYSTQILGGEWISLITKAYENSDGSAHQMVTQLETTLSDGSCSGRFSPALIQGIAELIRYAGSVVDDQTDAIDAEMEAVESSRRIIRPLLEVRLQESLDAHDQRHRGMSSCSHCGKNAPSQGRRRRTWGSLVGPLKLRRRYNYCSTCNMGFSPAQKKLGLPDGDFTARLEDVVTMLATTVPHAMANDLAEKICGVDISVKAVEDMVQRRAVHLHRQDAADAQSCAPFEDSGLPVPPSESERPTDAVKQVPRIAYLEMDGVVPITREEITGSDLSANDRRRQRRAKRRKARGGKGRRYTIVGREVKNAILYDGKNCVKESPGRGALLDKHYVSHLGNWRTFSLRVWVEMRRQRFDQAKLLVLLSDGADWIRSFAEWLPIPVMLILDLYHVKKRIWEVANAAHGERTPAARRWATAQNDRIEMGKGRNVIQALRFLKPKNKKTKELIESLKTYLSNNLDRMKYPDYRKRGLRVGSGAIESANFHVTGARLKLQGMRWSAQGATDMAALRADLFNNRWETRTRRILAA